MDAYTGDTDSTCSSISTITPWFKSQRARGPHRCGCCGKTTGSSGTRRRTRKTSTWEVRAAQKYYNKVTSACVLSEPDVLCRFVCAALPQYCIADMSRWKEGKVAMRRVEKEVVRGKGHFVCGGKTATRARARSYEVNFANEAGERKTAFGQAATCPRCGFQLHYKKYKALPRSEYKALKKLHEEAMANGGFEDDLAQQKRSDKVTARRTDEEQEDYLKVFERGRKVYWGIGEQQKATGDDGWARAEHSARRDRRCSERGQGKHNLEPKPKVEVARTTDSRYYRHVPGRAARPLRCCAARGPGGVDVNKLTRSGSRRQ